MLIPEDGKWRWNDGPLCDSKEEALKTAKACTIDSGGDVFVVDGLTEVMEEDEEDDTEGSGE